MKRTSGRHQVKPPPETGILPSDSWPPRSRKAGLVLAAVLATACVALVLGFGQLSYAATSVARAVQAAAHVIAPARSTVAPFSSAAAQYGEKVAICAVQSNGKQATILISNSAEPAYLAGHPSAFVGSCGVFRPHGVKANVCITIRRHRFAVYVSAGQLVAYLKRNPGSHVTKTGTCIRR
jgi:hypothetical protein